MVATAQSGSQPGAKKPAPVTLPPPAPVTVPPPAPVTLPPNGAPAVRGSIVPPTDYVIGPDDVLGIVFWREKELSADVVVRPDGKISLPLSVSLSRRFGLLQATALNMSNMIGIGPFITIPILMTALGGPLR